MSTTYEETTTSTVASGATVTIGPRPEYVRSIQGMLKIAEMVLDVIVLICASVDYWAPLGGGWVNFVACSALFTTLIFFIFHFINLIGRLPGPWTLIEFIYYCVYIIFYIIAAIICAVRAGYAASIAAAAFFSFAALAVYAVDAWYMYRAWQMYQHPATGGPGVATTTTTTTVYETRTQY